METFFFIVRVVMLILALYFSIRAMRAERRGDTQEAIYHMTWAIFAVVGAN